MTMQIMNTNFYIEVPSTSYNWKKQVSKWLHYVAKEWSRFIPNNELDQINQLPIGKTLTINSSLYDCLKMANDYYKQTDGLFSPYLKKQIEHHGYDKPFPFYINDKQKDEQNVELKQNVKNPLCFLANHQIYKTSDQPIDLGGFAKGYAAETVKQWLQSRGFRYGIVDGGGDMAIWSDGEKEWTIGIADPYDQEDIGRIKIQNGAIATSNSVYRSWRYHHEVKHHILNGQTGEVAASPIIQATVVTDRLYQAEVATKLSFLMPEKQLQEWLDKRKWRVVRFLVYQDHKTKWIKTGGDHHA